jgi:hypothetical protein
MNTEKKEHVVTEVYYPLGRKVPYLRRTGQPMEVDDPELQTCSEASYQNWMGANPEPKTLDGFYEVREGTIKRGDLVTADGQEENMLWASLDIGKTFKISPSKVSPIWRKITYRPLEPDEVIQEGDEFLNHKQEWNPFHDSVGETLKYSCFRCFETRTTRTKQNQATPNFDPKGDEGKKKPQLQLIPPVLNTELAKALSFGAYHRKEPYGPWNWRKNKVEYMTYIGAMKRHIDALLEREDVASDSGVHHLGHIAASCAIVLDAAKHGTLVDNRPPAKLNSFEIARKGEWEYAKDNSSPGKLNSEPVVDNGAFNGVE